MPDIGPSPIHLDTFQYSRPPASTQHSFGASPTKRLNFSKEYQSLMKKLNEESKLASEEFNNGNSYEGCQLILPCQRELKKEIFNIYGKIKNLYEKFEFIFGGIDEFRMKLSSPENRKYNFMSFQTLLKKFSNFLNSIKLEDQKTMNQTTNECIRLLQSLHVDITKEEYNLKQLSIDKILGYAQNLELILSLFVGQESSSGGQRDFCDGPLAILEQKIYRECFFLMKNLVEEITDKKNLLKQTCNDVGLPQYSLLITY